ncbi:sensor histidine kinase [Paenibacillus endoradicis]|uniref:sensor histidine kinase n=1 Tax=Paenibacillus endoradicis TaxID=2972487 RepID=UPI0021592C15|nr:ATP-binding protein [Paenibacillus endoradicis]MCR8658675.1 ATP-binding protein [Paenibacillus endoradicis]
MKRERLSFKIFWFTLVAMMLFIILWMILQTAFFGSFYNRQKSNELSEQLEIIYQKYADGEYELDTKPAEVLNFEQRFYGLTAMLYKQGNQINVYTGGYNAIPAIPMKPSSTIQPTYDIAIHSDSFQAIERSLLEDENAGMQKLVPATYVNRYNEQLSGALSIWLEDTNRFNNLSTAGEVQVTQIPSLEADHENLLIAAVKLPSTVHTLDGDAYLIALATLQPVGDAVQVMSRFYIYIYLLAALPILLFAYFLSRTITLPLIQLNKLAMRLNKLDFTAVVKTNRKDEIGQLAGTMNSLAQNLQQSMADLQEANTKLQADIEKEKQLEQLRKQFVASVSHELQTPVSLIQGYAEALKDNVTQGLKRDKYATVIIEESERMARLVTDLLDLSQLESGRFALHWSRVPLQETIRSVFVKLAPLLVDKSIHPQFIGIDIEELWVHSDRQRLEQVLINLLSNAIRHMPIQGHLEVRVKIEHSNVRLEIKNEGQPIPEEELHYIWDTFYRADRSGSREFGGTGIGLSIVKAILQLHESEYGVCNEKDGVMFYFTLPLQHNT